MEEDYKIVPGPLEALSRCFGDVLIVLELLKAGRMSQRPLSGMVHSLIQPLQIGISAARHRPDGHRAWFRRLPIRDTEGSEWTGHTNPAIGLGVVPKIRAARTTTELRSSKDILFCIALTRQAALDLFFATSRETHTSTKTETRYGL